MSLAPIERQALRDVEPDAAESRAMAADAEALKSATQARLADLGIDGEATVQGSVAKGTWLRSAGDIDLFLLLDPSVPAERLESIAQDVGRGVLSDVHKRYAQHPYLMGQFRGRAVDLVPAYRVAEAGARMSAVDRTPFHTAWVRSHLDEAKRGEVRLLKQWMKGTGTYGAQTATGGFSGYLVEVLVARFGSLGGVIDWLAAGAKPRRIALGPDQVEDAVSPLVVVDPVDPARNCAAAVQEETLATAVEAAKGYMAAPERRFFFPSPPSAMPGAELERNLAARGEAWLGLLLRPRTDRLDIVFPQFQKGARSYAAALSLAGFPVRRLACTALPDGSEVLLQWIAEARELPASRLHRGPAATGGPNADKFREKWAGHADAAGPVRTADGRLEVEVRVPHRTPAAWLRARAAAVAVGKHLTDAMPDARILTSPGEVPSQWAESVTEFALDRRPWQR